MSNSDVDPWHMLINFCFHVFQMISHGPKHWFRSQDQVSRRFRSKFTVSLLEVVLGLLQPLHPVLDLQVGVRLLKMVPNDFLLPKTWV